MLHYLALVWNESDPEKRETARFLLRHFRGLSPEWRTALEQEGLAVCYRLPPRPNMDRPYVLHEAQGIVLGRLFERTYAEIADTRETAPSPVVFDGHRSASLLSSEGRELMTRYWGQYVAFLRNARTGTTWVLRDPSGAMPCQWTRARGIDVYFVRLEDCERLEPVAFSINRHYLIGYLVYASACVRETGLNEIQTVLAGECITHRGERRTSSFYWNPLEIANRDIIESPADAIRLTRQVTRACVHAWSSCFDGVLHQLSGGLDSSIVLSCLMDAPTRPRIRCVNNYAIEPDADEREFARLAAGKARCELIEREVAPDPSFNFEPLKHIPRALSPYPCTEGPEAARREGEFLQAQGMPAQFSGDGGDELFYRLGPLPAAVDFAWRHGLRPALFALALDDAAAHHLSLWRVLRLVRDYGVFKHGWHLRSTSGADYFPLMCPDIKREAARDESLWHPLFRGAPNLPPGKFCHAYTLAFGTAFGHIPGNPENIPVCLSPLLSQPLIELSLRIPLYVLTGGGRDRAIAREAFAADIPREIFLRQSKAHGNASMQTLVDRNLAAVRELLLDGFLVRESFVDRGKLERVLSGELTRIRSGIMEIIVYLCVEAWALSWNGRSSRCSRRQNRLVSDRL